MVLRMIDLFAGSGAFTYAFEQTGHVSCVFANDIVPASKTNYDANFSHPLTLQDINTVKVEDIPAHDILTGGFPCQPFSIAGNREGFEDERSNVFWKIIEIIKYHTPKCVVLENVKNIVGHDNGNTFKIIKQHLEEECGYHLTTKVLDTVEITGIPQHRERIYIVAIRDKTVYDNFNLIFPKVPKLPLRMMFSDGDIPPRYYYTEESSTWGLLSESVIKRNTIYQYRRVYVRENKNDVCPTLTANMGTGGHNVPIILDDKGIRKLTPRECFNFQGFPSTYVLEPSISNSQLYKLAGNAVSLPVVELIANRLVSLLV